MNDRQTIIALSTPPGVAALALLRLSGAEVRALTEPFLQKPISWLPGRAYYRNLHQTAAPHIVLDDVVLTYFRAPHSYTGEDVVEISCHGNPRLVQQLIQAYLTAGARMARPGEFTERAFLNDKLPLTQAEGVLDLITAPTERALASAQAMKDGRLGVALEAIRTELVDLLSHLEASLDFAEDGIEPSVGSAFFERIGRQQAKVQELLRTAPLGRILREGALVVIVGEPNVGKSSLLNALLREDRAIVAATPGTTRDLIEAECNVRGLPIRLIDTAGQRESSDPVEAEGIRRARAKQDLAQLILRVVEAHQPFAEQDQPVASVPTLLLANKSDLGMHKTLPTGAIAVSATSGTGLAELEGRIEAALLGDTVAVEGGLTVNSRQSAALQRVDVALTRARKNGEDGLGLELVSIDLRDALAEMADLIGETTNEDILTRLFLNFCIGK